MCVCVQRMSTYMQIRFFNNLFIYIQKDKVIYKGRYKETYRHRHTHIERKERDE